MEFWSITADGYFTGYTTVAQRNPRNPDTFLIPDCAVAIEPPVAQQHQRARWTGQEWTLEDIPVEAASQVADPTSYEWRLKLIDDHIQNARSYMSFLTARGIEPAPEWQVYVKTLENMLSLPTEALIERIVPPYPPFQNTATYTPQDTPPERAEQAPSLNLTQRQTQAKHRLGFRYSLIIDLMAKGAPDFERAIWPEKAAAASAYLDRTHTNEQESLLRSEIAITGESIADLCAKILARAAIFDELPSIIAGFRRHNNKLIDASTEENFNDIIAAIKSTMISFFLNKYKFDISSAFDTDSNL